jgi:hypothetical protein
VYSLYQENMSTVYQEEKKELVPLQEEKISGDQTKVFSLTLWCGYLPSDDMLRLCFSPLLREAFANTESWSGRTVAFDIRSPELLEKLVFLCSRFLLFDGELRPSQASVRIQVTVLRGEWFRDAHLGELAVLGRLLQSLVLNRCSFITDGGLAHLAGLESLQRLDIPFCQKITNGGLAHLAGLTSMRSLTLQGCKQITEQGLVHLSDMKNLQYLDLGCGTAVANGSVAFLAELNIHVVR